MSWGLRGLHPCPVLGALAGCCLLFILSIFPLELCPALPSAPCQLKFSQSWTDLMALPSTLARPSPWSSSMSLTSQSHSPARAELPRCACSPALCPSRPLPLGACCGPRTWFSPQFCSCQAQFHRLSLAVCQCGTHPTVLPSWACRLLHRTLAPWCCSAAWFPGDPSSLIHVSSVLGLPPEPQGRSVCACLRQASGHSGAGAEVLSGAVAQLQEQPSGVLAGFHVVRGR